MTTAGNAGLVRPIVGIENRTPREVFDIMCDRIRHAAALEATASPVVTDAMVEAANNAKPYEGSDITVGDILASANAGIVAMRAALSAALPITAPPASPALRDAAKAILAHKPDYADTLWQDLEEALAEPVDPTSDAEQAAYWKGAYDRMAARNGTMANALTLAIATLDDLSRGHGLSRPIEQIIRELDACSSSGGHPTAPPADDTHAFKNFHRLLCERFGYTHDEVDWRRDQVSLIEWIAKLTAPPARDETFSGTVDGDTPLQAAAREAGWALMELVNDIDWKKRDQVSDIISKVGAALVSAEPAKPTAYEFQYNGEGYSVAEPAPATGGEA